MAWAHARCGRADTTRAARIDDEMQRQFRALGFEVAIDGDDDGGMVDIMECNWPSLKAFLACSTQWRVIGLQTALIFIGLDYAACQLPLQHLNASPDIFADLQAMEDAALHILNEVA